MKKIAILMALALASFSFAADKIQPTRVGPVSYYGSLQASGGYLYGSKSGTEKVQLKGMSMYWDYWDAGSPFYTASVINALVDKWKVEIIRVAHGTPSTQNAGNSTASLDADDAVIQAAIDNDIYVIIDYHSHYANDEITDATTFFTRMASKWGSYPNVIFEIFNEPKDANMWGTVKTYANTIISVIRSNGGTDNLIVVGNSEYSAHPEEAINSKVTDSKNNVAYTFHFYANSHHTDGGQWDGYSTFVQRVSSAIQAGLTVFVTEWGVGTADGKELYNTTDADAWMTFLDQKMISWCNWSVSNKDEAASAFRGQSTYTNPTNWSYDGYSTSGKYVYDQLASHAASVSWRTGTSGSSSSVQADEEFIDDFEDGDGTAFTGGSWYAYTDKGEPGAANGNGKSSITNAANDEGDGYIVVFAADNSTEGMAALKGIVLNAGTYIYDPYVALGLNLNEDESVYDLSSCESLEYKYKGAAHTFKVQTPEVEDYNYHTTDILASKSWKTATVDWSDLQQANWEGSPKVTLNKKKIDKFAWVVEDTDDANYLYIDDLRCVGGTIERVSSSSAAGSSSSSKPKSSSSSHVNPTCEDGETIDVGSTHMLCVDGEWTEVKVSSSSTVSTVVMIDDVDDGNTGVETLGEDGYWFLYTAGGSISNTQGADQVWDMVRGNSNNYYVAMEDISDITYGDKSYPSVGMSMNIPASALAGCTAIKYDYKGSGHMFRAAMSTVTAESGYEHATDAQNKATSWTTVTVGVDDLAQPSWIPKTEKQDFAWNLVYQLVWVVDEKIKDAQRGTYLDVDNVQCVGTLPDIGGSSSSGTVVPSSSSAEPECTEGQEIHVGASDLKCVDGKWTEMNTSSSSSSPNSSASTPGFAVIDDFQDENTQSESLGEAYWYIYKAGGSVTNKQDTKTKSWDMVRIDGENAYVAMEGISGITYGATTYPSVGMGLDIPTSAFTNCTAITYDYRGSAHKFRASVSTVTPDEGYEHVTDIQPKASAWTQVTVTAADLAQPTWIPATEKKTFSWAQVVKMAWVVDEKIANADRGTNLDVDNVTCIGSLPTPKSSSSVKPKSSSSVKPVSSSSAGVKPGSSSGANNGGAGNNGTNNGNINGNDNGYGMAIGDIASPAGLDASIMGKTLVVSVARAGLVKVQVFDMMGHAIESHSESMAAGSFAHDFAKLNKGAYIVRVRQGSMVKTLRMQVR